MEDKLIILRTIISINLDANLFFIICFLSRIIVAAGMVEKERSRRLTTATLNQLMQEAVAFKPPPRTRGGRRGRVYYCTQVLVV